MGLRALGLGLGEIHGLRFRALDVCSVGRAWDI